MAAAKESLGGRLVGRRSSAAARSQAYMTKMAVAATRATRLALLALNLAVVGGTPLTADRTSGWRRPAKGELLRPPSPSPPPRDMQHPRPASNWTLVRVPRADPTVTSRRGTGRECTKDDETLQKELLVFPLKNGVLLDGHFVYKAGSTEWKGLLLLHLTGHRKADPQNFKIELRRRNITMLRGFRASDLALLYPYRPLEHLITVRNPYERILSAYLDKIVSLREAGRRVQLKPRGFSSNGTFAEFVAAAASERTPTNGLAAMHYGPITRYWRNCCGDSDQQCRQGIHERYRVLKIEEMAQWYAPIVRSLGLERDVLDPKAWARTGCFYREPNTTCSDSLLVKPLEAPHAIRTESGCRAATYHTDRHDTRTCDRMSTYYTPEVAKMVTDYFRADLERFGYPEWDGDISHAWY